MSQCGTQFRDHLVFLLARIANAHVVPHTEAHGVRVFVGPDANPAPVLCHMLDGGPAVEVSSQQASQATTIDLDDVQALAFVLANARSLTDHRAIQRRDHQHGQASRPRAGSSQPASQERSGQ